MSRPLYPRLLGLRHVHPNGWQRALLADAPVLVAAILILADVASAWTLLALPLAVAMVVKAHDVLAGWLGVRAPSPAQRQPRPPRGGAAFLPLPGLRAPGTRQ